MSARSTSRGSGSGSRHWRSEEHTSELQSQSNLVCRLLLEKKKGHGADKLSSGSRRPMHARFALASRCKPCAASLAHLANTDATWRPMASCEVLRHAPHAA